MIQNNSGSIQLKPGQAFWHPFKTARAHTSLGTQISALETENKALKADVAGLTAKLNEFEKEKNALAARRAKATQITSMENELPGIFGEDSIKITQALWDFQRTGDPLPVSLCTPKDQNAIFWNAVGGLHDSGKLEMHSVGNELFGARIEGPVLKRNYYMNKEIVTGLLKGIATIAGDCTRGKITINIQDMGKGAISLDFRNTGRMDTAKLELIKVAAELLGISVEYGNSNVMVRVPYQN